MNRSLKVFLVLFIVSLIILALFKWTGLKKIFLNLRGPTRKTPSMLRALPFETLQEREKKRLPLLRLRLTPTQVLIENILANPRGAPAGKYVRVSVVIEARDKKEAEVLREKSGRLAGLILDTIQRFPYERLQSRGGLLAFKKALTQRLVFLYGDRIKDVSIVEFRWGQSKRR